MRTVIGEALDVRCLESWERMLCRNGAPSPVGFDDGNSKDTLSKSRCNNLGCSVSQGRIRARLQGRSSRQARGRRETLVPHPTSLALRQIVALVDLSSGMPIARRIDPVRLGKERRLNNEHTANLCRVPSVEADAIPNLGNPFSHFL